MTKPNWLRFAELAGFQLVWLACAIGAAHGLSAPGIGAAMLYSALCLAIVPRRQRITLLLASASMGFVGESLLAVCNYVRYSAPWPSEHLAPAWIVALWLAFGNTLEPTSRLLGHQWVTKAAVLGGIGGPLAYLAAARLGALTPSAPSCAAYIAVAVLWSTALPALIAIIRTSPTDDTP